MFERFPRKRHFWALQSNPTSYDIQAAVRDLDVDPWTTKGHDIRAGDRIVFWKAKGRDPVRGIVGLGQVLTNPQLRGWESEGDAEYWVKPPPKQREWRVDIRYVRMPNLPIWLGGPHDDVLLDLTVSRGQGTVFKVTPEQWEAVVRIAGGWPSDLP